MYRYLPEKDPEEAVLPSSEVSRILHEYHDSPTVGHYGIEKLKKKLVHGIIGLACEES